MLTRHYLSGIGKSKSKSYSDIGALKSIANKLSELEKRQGVIFEKFTNLHRIIQKNAGVDSLESELKSLQGMVTQVTNSLEGKGLGLIIDRSQELANLFKQISSNDQGLTVFYLITQNLLKLQDIGIKFKEPAKWPHYIIWIGSLGVGKD